MSHRRFGWTNRRSAAPRRQGICTARLLPRPPTRRLRIRQGPAGAQVPVAATDSEHAKLAVPTPGTATPAAPVPQPADSTSAIDKEPAVESATAMRAVEADQRPAAVPEMTSQAASDAAAAASDAAAAAPARERGNVAPLSAADRAANIAALYASGDVTAAADALRAFRAADPDADAFLPESLRNWARTVE